MNDTPANQQIEQESAKKSSSLNDDILASIAAHNPSQSPIVEKFLQAFYEGKQGTCLQLLDEGNLVFYDHDSLDKNLDEYGKMVSEKTRDILIGRIKKLNEEKRTYSQFYFSIMDVIAQTPALMAFAKVQMDDFTKTMIKAAKRPHKKPDTWSFVGSVLYGLIKVLTSRKTRNLLAKYMKKLDFKSPFLLLVSQNELPSKFESLKPHIEKLDAAGKNYAAKRKEWEISKMPGTTYEERLANWEAQKIAEMKAEQEAEEAENNINESEK